MAHTLTSLSLTLQLSTVQATILPQSPAEAKKHQLASQLFGGLSGPSRPPKSKQHRKNPTTSSSFDTAAPASSSSQLKPPRQVAAAMKKPKEPQVDLLLDLEGIDFSSPAPSAAAEQTIGGSASVQQNVMSAGLGMSGGGIGIGGSGGGGLLANMEIRGGITQDTKTATSAPPTARYSVHMTMYLI